MWRAVPPLGVLLAWTLSTVVVIVLGALLTAWSGLYNVAATSGHWSLTRWFLEFALRNSVATQSLLIRVPKLDDQNLIRLGAGHYAGGCAPCHGAPGQPRNPITRHMLPAPPLLSEAVPHWDAPELFWIVKNGLKYTGMPSWVAPRREDEVWAVVAFLRMLPSITVEEYRRLAHDNVEASEIAPAEIMRVGTGISALTACGRCHGGAGSHPTSSLVPILAGQNPRYLERALRDYASGDRPSGIMQPIAAALDEGEITRLAAYYASLPWPTASHIGLTPATVTPGLAESGRRIASEGVPQQGIPPCLSCHGSTRSALFPRLAGQHAAYIATQLRVWKGGGANQRPGLRDTTVPGRIMATIARRLTDEQITAVAAYFASLTSAGAVTGDGPGVPP